MKMAFKRFNYSLWMFFILFAMVQGSCLEYGHSCWGAHGKRSGNSKIFHGDVKLPTEVDFQDLNGLSEKNSYDSNEEQLNDSNDNLTPLSHDATPKDTDDLFEPAEKTASRFKKFLYKQLNKRDKEHQSLEPVEHNFQKTSNGRSMLSERWRRLPIYNLKRIQITKPDNDWLKELERETQSNDEDYI